jgi:phytoene/squalene synthetase
MTESDWSFCQQRLVEVSRTFSQPIAMLPDGLERSVTCAYLLCRIVDTIEDHPDLSDEYRDELYSSFVEVVEGRSSSASFVDLFSGVSEEGNEFDLCRGIPRVMRVFRDLDDAQQGVSEKWIVEMAGGMAEWSHRSPGEDGVVASESLEDLARYCYFVAGTVGHMLTGLFLHEIPDLGMEREEKLKANSESFGRGLQLVNILKDITDDAERGVSFIPRDVIAAQGLTFSMLAESGHREAAHRALVPVFEEAETSLEAAFEYCLALPSDQREIRLFCLLPLWMAVRTLVHARGNDSQFIVGEKVKISRDEVHRLVEDCVARCEDNDALREGFASLRTE